MFTFTANESESRIVYLDCAVHVDPAIREKLDLQSALPDFNVISRDIEQPVEQVFSLVYDSFMGHHTLSYVARLAEKRFGVTPDVLQKIARAEFVQRGGSQVAFPETVYYYDNKLHPSYQWRLVDTGQSPQWR